MLVRSLFRKIEAIPFFMTGFYDWIAKNSPFLKDAYKEIAKEVCSKISFGKILDIGSGPGYLTLEIAKMNQKLEITGVDISAGMVELARKNQEKAGLPVQINFQVGSADSLSFEEGSFDFVLSTFSFHHWAKPREGLKEIFRVLKPGKESWIYDIRYDVPRETKKQFRQRYGWFLSFLFFNITRLHSSMPLKEVKEIISSLGVSFSEANIEDRGVIFKLRLKK